MEIDASLHCITGLSTQYPQSEAYCAKYYHTIVFNYTAYYPRFFIMSNRDDVEAFLTEARDLIFNKRAVIVPRDVNAAFMKSLEIDSSEAWRCICRLTANNYCKGPEDDHGGSETSIWVFGTSIDRTAIYIKVKIVDGRSGRYLKCLSFHASDGTLRFPLRPRF